LSDRFGRRLPIALGLFLFIVGSAGCALSMSAEIMVAWRMVQALGACAGVVHARAIVRDLYTGERAAQMLSILITVMAVAPLVGPLAGAQILALASWQAIFWTLVGDRRDDARIARNHSRDLAAGAANARPLAQAYLDYGSLLLRPQLMA
jgi:DHA1 family bicyclomycin/chloramphenicol resistance-like MFS transporter